MITKGSLALAVFFVVTSAAAQPAYRDNPVKYKGISEEKTYHLYNNKDYPSAHLKFDFFYPESYNDKFILEKTQALFIGEFFGQDYMVYDPKEAARQYLVDYVACYKKQFEESGLFLEEKKSAEARGERIEDYISLYINEEVIRNTILFNKRNLISQVINRYTYTGGAHGLSYTKGVTIDLSTGNILGFDDVFKEDAKEDLADLILEMLMREFKADSMDNLEEMGFFFDEFQPSTNFVVDAKGITFIYGQYELGAYALGIIEVPITYHYLLPYIKEESPVSRIMTF